MENDKISSILILRGLIRRPNYPTLLMKECIGHPLLLTNYPEKRIIIFEEDEFDLTEYIKKNWDIGLKSSVSIAFSDNIIELFDDVFITSDRSKYVTMVDKFEIGEYRYSNPECPHYGIGSSDVLKFNGKSFYEVIWDNISRDIREINLYLEMVSYKE